MGEIVRRTTTLNAVGEHATAFLVGMNYHSCCPIDFDIYYVGSELSQKEKDKVIYYLLFQLTELKFSYTVETRFYNNNNNKI